MAYNQDIYINSSETISGGAMEASGYITGREDLTRAHREALAVLSNSNEKVLGTLDRMIGQWEEYVQGHSDFPFSKLLNAIAFAAQKHEGQTRKDREATPYIVHPIGVALSLWVEGGVRDPAVMIAAVLHDTLEDTSATQEEITLLFGVHVAKIVQELTNPAEMSSEEAKAWQIEHAPSLSFEARVVKLADRLYNLRDLREPPVGWSDDKIQKYFGWGQKLLDVLKGTNAEIEQQLQAEIDAHSNA